MLAGLRKAILPIAVAVALPATAVASSVTQVTFNLNNYFSMNIVPVENAVDLQLMGFEYDFNALGDSDGDGEEEANFFEIMLPSGPADNFLMNGATFYLTMSNLKFANGETLKGFKIQGNQSLTTLPPIIVDESTVMLMVQDVAFGQQLQEGTVIRGFFETQDDIAAIPLPASGALLLAGLGALALYRRRQAA